MSEILNFGEAHIAAKSGSLHIYLERLKKETWHVRGINGTSLLHVACLYPNSFRAIRMLIRNGCDVNARAAAERVPLHYAIRYPSYVELLCAAGADPNLVDAHGRTPMRYAGEVGAGKSQYALIACGVRVRKSEGRALLLFQKRILACRSRVVALLRVKKAGNLWRWDKFLLREIAYAVWSTRQF